MKLCRLLFVWLLAATQMVSAQPAGGEAFTGKWVMADGSAVVAITQNQQEWQIRILAIRDAAYTSADDGLQSGEPRVDLHNPDQALRSRGLGQLLIGEGFTLDGDSLTGGRIYDPGSGNNYKSTLTLMPDGLLQVRGFIGISLLGRTMYWYPLEEYRARMTTMLGIVDDRSSSLIEP
jgi:uncharacterized protein (DUF2147 family)